MYAQLGNIRFDLITYFNGFDEAKSYTFAEHSRIENKPRLQYTGESLEELNIKLNFHSSFCNPENEISKLKTLANTHQLQPFILGNGKYIGTYIIENIASTLEQSDKQGNIISVQTQIKLREWTGQIKAETKPKQGLKTR
nr:hypothetical protein 4 [bacterium]